MSSTPESGHASSLQDRLQSLRLGQNIRVPPRRSAKVFWLIVFLVVGGCIYWAYRTYGSEWGKVFASATSTATAADAKAAEGEREKVDPNIALEAGGYIVPMQRVQVSPKVGGQVKELFIEEGSFVKQGQPLAKLEVDEYLFDFNRMQAMAALAEAKFQEAKKGNRDEEKWHAEAAEKEAAESLRQARDELAKLKASGNAVSFDELDKAASRVRIAEQKLEQQKAQNVLMKKGTREERIAAAKAEYDQVCAERDKAKWRLDNCTVVAPISGVILEKKTELGNTVRPEAFSNGLSASVCDMADLRSLEVEVDISERDIRRIRKGQKCVIRTEAFVDKKYEGAVARIMPVASRSKASVTVRVKIEVPAEEKDLRPEMRARVQFLKEGGADAPVTASSAAPPSKPGDSQSP
jgi:HlyD family secretion protein